MTAPNVMTTSTCSPRAKALATSGSSNAPGAQATVMSLRSTPCSARTLSAPSTSRDVTPPLNRPHANPTRTPRPSSLPTKYWPTRGRRMPSTSGSNSVSSLDVIKPLQEMSHSLSLRAQVVDVKGRGPTLEGDALDDVEAESLESAVLGRIVRHQSHRGA